MQCGVMVYVWLNNSKKVKWEEAEAYTNKVFYNTCGMVLITDNDK